jgi:WD40 repeat protein
VSDHRASVWDVKTGKELGPARTGHEGLIGGLAFAPDGTLFTGSDDGTGRGVAEGWCRVEG